MSKTFFKSKANKIDEPEFKVLDSTTPFAIRESFKSLYSNILYLNIEDKCKKIAVTSAVSGEGKTSVSTNLSITFAQNLEDKRILLIDCDMRQPRVAKLLSLDQNSHGLSEYLAGIDETPNFQYVEQYKLTVLTSGASNVNPTKLIGSSRLAMLIQECEEQFDYIIIDTPPVTVVTDAILLQGNVNGYIISTKADYSNINLVNECIDALNRVGAEIYGLVLSSQRLKSTGKRYGRYGYGRYSRDND